MPPAKLQELITQVELREIPRRQVIYLPGDPGEQVYFINGGRVKTSKVTRDGKELTLAYRGAGQVFGELAVVDGSPREEMAEAMKNAIITELPVDVFRELLTSDAQAVLHVHVRTSASAASSSRPSSSTSSSRTSRPSSPRCCSSSATSTGTRPRRACRSGSRSPIRRWRTLIGSTRETISLTLAQFKKRELLDMNGRTVVLLDLEGIRAAT